MYTGKQLGDDLATRVRQGPFTGYFGTDEKNQYVRMAVTSLLEENYASVVRQGATDEINPLVKIYKPFLPFNKKVLLKPLHIVSIANPSTNNYDITFDRDHNIDFTTYPTVSVTFDGLQGGTYSNFNGNVYDAIFVTNKTIRVNELGITGTYTNNTGECSASSDPAGGKTNYWPSDYYHLLAVAVVCRANLNVTVSAVKNISTVDITVGINNFDDRELLRFSSFGGLSGLTGDKYIKKIGDRKIRLYNDANLTVPFTTSGTWTSGGVIERYYGRSPKRRYCEPFPSDQRVDSSEITPWWPLYTVAGNEIVCYTSESNFDTNITQIEYLMDYISIQAIIDTENDITDLLQTYNQQFCNKIIERAAKLFYAMNSSQADIQISEVIQ